MKYRSEIDGLRALAVIPVILFHAGFKVFSGGFVGVDVFFVISGYLITTILVKDLEAGKFSIVHFYERRARRILPALFLVMIACIPFAWIWLLPSEYKSFSQSMIGVLVFSSNILFWRTSGYFDTATELKPLIHTWSLSVEEQYYVLFPLFLFFAWKLGKRWTIRALAVVAILSLGLAQWLVYKHQSFTFYMLPTRAWELLMGAFVAFYYSEHNIKKHKYWASELGSLLGFALIGYATFAYSEQTPFPSLYALVPTIGAVLIIIFATHKTLIGKLLSTKPFLWVGLVSYSAYLWHQPLFAFARHRSLDEPSQQLLATLVIFTLLLAYLTWRFVERPFRNRHLITRNQIFTLSFIFSLIFLGIGFIGHIGNGIPTRLPMTVQKAIEGQFARNPKSCMSGPGNLKDPSQACVLGNDSRILGALIGDSHAGAISYSLGQQLEAEKMGVIDLTSDGCTPIFDVFSTYAGSECLTKKNINFKYIKSNEELQFVIIAGRWTRTLTDLGFNNQEGGVEPSSPYFNMLSIDGQSHPVASGESKIIEQKLIETIKAYISTNKVIVVIYPIPEAGWDIPTKLAKEALFMQNESILPDHLSTSFGVYKSRNNASIKLLDSIGDYPNLIRIRPEQYLCDTYVENRCITQLKGVPLYYDDDHLNTFGANLITQHIVKSLAVSTSSN
jgi:peptidoglycan/LPS O-acetylase OafA/YrhL